MNSFLSNVKPFALGTVSGAIAWWMLLAFAFGWMSAGTAETLAEQQTDKAVVAALAPICADKFMTQPNAAARKAELADASDWNRRDYFPREWVTLPGDSWADPDLISACSNLVLNASEPVSGAEAKG